MRLSALVLVCLSAPALADSFTVASVPAAVTVYPYGASVTRIVSLEVPQGAHRIVLPDLPRDAVASGLRVEIDGATLSGSQTRDRGLPALEAEADPAVEAAQTRVDDARRALDALNDSVDAALVVAAAAGAQIGFLEGLQQSETLPSEIQALRDLSRMIRDTALDAHREAQAARQQARDLGTERAALETALADAERDLEAARLPDVARAELTLAISAAQAGTIEARVTYFAQASWQPVYNLFLTRGAAPMLTIERGATVQLTSGEDWTDVTLALSTLSPSDRVAPSIPFPQRLEFFDPEMARRFGGADSVALDAPESALVQESAAAKASFDGPGVTYDAPQKVSISRAGEGTRIILDTLDFDADVFARAVPAQDPTAYLMATFTNTTREPLLRADEARFYVDGALVGLTAFMALPAGADSETAFGPVEDLRLSYTVLDRSEGDRGVINRENARTEAVRMEIENLGKEDWQVELLGSVPYSEQDDLVIDWTAQPRPDEMNVEDQRGTLQWNLTVAPGSTETITIEQDIRWPSDMKLRNTL